MAVLSTLSRIPLISWILKWHGKLIAKFTPFWMIWHLLRRTDRPMVTKLHDQDVVQIAPSELSVSDKSLVYIPKLTSFVDQSAYKDFEPKTHKSNLFSQEHEIDSCNQQRFNLLSIASKKGENIDIRALLMRFAYEVVITTTTGQHAGFLEPTQGMSNIDAALSNWKFYVILYGSYLRDHSFIHAILKLYRFVDKTNVESLMGSNIEARIALALAGADPTITLLLNATQHIYANPLLFERLRGEITSFKESHAPTFKVLIHHKANMPLLHSILLECARLQLPYITGPRYKAGAGVEVGDVPVAPGTLITLEPSITQTNSDIFGDETFSFKPERWLDSDRLNEMKYNLLAFNASTATPIEAFQLLISSKFLTSMVDDFDLASCHNKHGHCYVLDDQEKLLATTIPQEDSPSSDDTPSQEASSVADSSADSSCAAASSAASSSAAGSSTKVHCASRGNKIPVTITAADRLISILGEEDAEELLNGRFAPRHTHFPKKALITKVIEGKHDRYLIHEALHEMYGERIEHITHPKNFTMAIGPYGSIPREYPNRRHNHQQRPNQQNGRYNNSNNNRRQYQPPAPRPPRPEPERPANAAWGQWASTEEQRVNSFKTAESYAKQRAAAAKAEEEVKANSGSDNEAKKPRYITTYKQTGSETTNGKLGGPRKTYATETFDTTGKVDLSKEQRPPRCDSPQQSEQKPEAATEKPKALPPHLRRKQEQEQAQKAQQQE